MNIVVLAGGISTERDVSIVTGTMVTNALVAKGHKAVLADVFMGYDMEGNDYSGEFLTAHTLPAAKVPETAADSASRPRPRTPTRHCSRQWRSRTRPP